MNEVNPIKILKDKNQFNYLIWGTSIAVQIFPQTSYEVGVKMTKGRNIYLV